MIVIIFTGYLLFDYLIANGDRHSKNWGIQIDPFSGRKELLPLYDCGFSMRFANSRNQGSEYLRWYTEDMETAIKSETDFPMQMREIVKKLEILKPDAVTAWSERIESIDREFVTRLFAQIPDEWIKESQIAPAIDLIDFNREQISAKMLIRYNQKQALNLNLSQQKEISLNPKTTTPTQVQIKVSQKPKSLADLNEPEVEADSSRPNKGLLYELANDPDATKLTIEPDDSDDLSQEDSLSL
jgi:hypothetical protein